MLKNKLFDSLLCRKVDTCGSPLRCNEPHNFNIMFKLYWGQKFHKYSPSIECYNCEQHRQKQIYNTITYSRFNYPASQELASYQF